MKLRPFLVVAVGLFAAALSLYPQYRLAQLRGAEYEGAFATYDLDEMAYASYLQALIDGRPRKNDPYTGRDEASGSPQYESLFSIQFFTAYMAAVPARGAGITAPQAMPVISAVSAFLTALAVFWMAFLLSRNDWLAWACAVTVVSCGALISGIGAIGSFGEGGIAYPYLPFLRRHIPSLSFPFMFAFLGCLWKGTEAGRRKERLLWAVASAACFSVLLFSYFYLWTTAVAVFMSLGVLSVALAGRRRVHLEFFGVALVLMTLAAVPYTMLLAGRSPTIESIQLLVHTRLPDIDRNIVVIGALSAVIIAVAAWTARPRIGRAVVVFIAAIGLAGPAVFNQQIITGRSLQPFHYEFYSANYVVLFGLCVLIGSLLLAIFENRKAVSTGIFVAAGLIAGAWGVFEAVETTKIWDDSNIVRDEAMPVNRLLRQKALGGELAPSDATLNLEPLQADSQPTVAPVGVLWARHQHTFSGVQTHDENRLRFYKLIYFSELDEQWLHGALTGCSYIDACMVLFGWDRFNPTLSGNYRPLVAAEIDEEVRRYEDFERSFSAADAYEPRLSYVVARADQPVELRRLGAWYELQEEKAAGKYTLRRLVPRQ